MGSAVTTHSPSLLGTVARSTPMVALATTTSALATTAPEVSRTVPVKVAVSCAKTAPAARSRAIRQQAWRRKFMYVSLMAHGVRVFCEPEMLKPEAAGIARWMAGGCSTAGRLSWTGLAGEWLSRQVVTKSVMDPTPNVLLNLLKQI